MAFDDYKVVVFCNQPDGWVAEILAVPDCYALMPTPEQAVVELREVFQLIAQEPENRKHLKPLLPIQHDSR